MVGLHRRLRVLHFQLQVIIGTYGHDPMEMYLVHGMLLLLALVVVQWVLTQVSLSFLNSAEILTATERRVAGHAGHLC